MRKLVGVFSIIMAVAIAFQVIFAICYNAVLGITYMILEQGSFAGTLYFNTVPGAVVQFIAGPILILLAIFTAIGCFRKKSVASYIISMVAFIILLIKFTVDFAFVSFDLVIQLIDTFVMGYYISWPNLILGILQYLADALKLGCLAFACLIMTVAFVSLVTKSKKFVKAMKIFALLSFIPIALGVGAAGVSFIFEISSRLIYLFSDIFETNLVSSLLLVVFPGISALVDFITAAVIFIIIALPIFVVVFRCKEIHKLPPPEPAGLLGDGKTVYPEEADYQQVITDSEDEAPEEQENSEDSAAEDLMAEAVPEE